MFVGVAIRILMRGKSERLRIFVVEHTSIARVASLWWEWRRYTEIWNWANVLDRVHAGESQRSGDEDD